MYHLYIFIFNTLLFFALTHNILVTFPPNSNKITVALVHALIFTTILCFVYKLISNTTEGFKSNTASNSKEEKEKISRASLAILSMKAKDAKEDYEANKVKK